MMSHQNKALPTAIAAKLRSIRIRHTCLTLLRGVAISLAIFLLAMVLAMSLDWLLTLFSTTLRTSLTAVTFLSAICSFGIVVYPRLKMIFKSTQAAADADEAIPQLEERWTTVASFAESSQQPTSSNSKAMLEQVHSEALAMQRLVKPSDVVRPTSLKPVLASLGATLLITAAFMALNLQQTSVLVKRFFAPTQNITATSLASKTGDVTVPRGEIINLEAEATGLLRDNAILTIENETGIVDVFELSADQESPEKFLHEMRAEESLRYQLRSGDGLTEWYSVNVIDYPEIAEVDLKIEPPKYLNRPGIEKTLIPSRVKVVQGSRLKLRLKPVEQLKSLSLSLAYENSEGEQQTSELSLQPEADGWYRFETQLIEHLTFSPKLLSLHDLKNEDRRICHIQVIEDMAPVARIVSPTDEMSVAADDTIEIEFEAHDDHGIAKAELVIYDETNVEEGEEPEILEVREIPLGEQQLQKHLMGKTTLDLKELGLREGTSISYSVRVSDNRELDIDPETVLAQSSEARPESKTDSNEEPNSTSGNDSSNEESEGSETLAMAETSEADPSQTTNSNEKSDGSMDESSKPADSSEIASNENSESSPSTTKRNTSEGNNEQVDSQNGKSSKEPRAEGSSTLAENKTLEPTDGKTNENPSDTSVATDEKLAVAFVNSSENKIEMKGEETPPTPSEAKSKNNPKSLAESNSKADQPKSSNSSKNSDESENENRDSENASLASSEPDETGTNPIGQPATSQTETPVEEMKTPSISKDDSDPQAVASNDDTTTEEATSTSESSKEMTSRNLAENDSKPNDPAQPKNASESALGNPKPKEEEQSSDEKTLAEKKNNSPSGSGGGQKNKQKSNETQPPPSKPIRMTAQNSESNQNTETNRRRLKITERLTGLAKAAKKERQVANIRDKVVVIDTMLEDILAGLERLIQREIPDAERGQQYEQLDGQLGEAETFISELREQTEEGEYAFVGLQMVDIARTHVTPARDRVFAAVRNPITSDSDTTIAKGHIIRARELLAALLARYDRVTRDKKLAESIEDSVEIYEVYVEKMQKLMRERRQNKNPLKREMAVIEVDQEYLDRYAEVMTLRREMMREFGRMLSDDPRLLARYMDLIKRRNNSLRDQLSELTERQDEIAYELSSWLAADEVQQEDVWTIVVELRLFASEELAKDAAELAERVEKQLPLTLESTDPLAGPIIQQAEEIAVLARTISFEADDLMALDEESIDSIPLENANTLLEHFNKLEGSLDRLVFERDGDEEVEAYVSARLADSRRVADQAVRWKHIVSAISRHQFNKLSELDQWQLNVATELLRMEMLAFEDQIEGQFQQQADSEVPGEIVDLIRQLHRVMEAITFHQSAATFAAQANRLNKAEIQQAMSLEKFELAEDLFDKIRRAVIAELDQYEVNDPNIANLQDPTLDEFLAQLEREPNIETQLGIPNRSRNLRVNADSMAWQQNGGGLGNSAEQARMRAQKAMELAQAANKKQQKKNQKPQAELTEEEKAKMEKTQQMQEMLEKSLAALEEQMKDPQTPSEDRQRLERMKKNLQRMLREVGEEQNSAEEWERIVQRDQAAEILKALAAGKPVPDEQWNKLLSTLEDGLWQVRGKRPPEEYLPAIEQYQDRLRELLSTVPNGAE